MGGAPPGLLAQDTLRMNSFQYRYVEGTGRVLKLRRSTTATPEYVTDDDDILVL